MPTARDAPTRDGPRKRKAERATASPSPSTSSATLPGTLPLGPWWRYLEDPGLDLGPHVLPVGVLSVGVWGRTMIEFGTTALGDRYHELAADPTRVGYVARLEAGGSRHSQVMDFVAYVRARRYLNNAHEAAMAAGLDRCSARSSSPEQGILRPLPTPPERTWHRRRPCQTKRPSCPNDSVSRAPSSATASALGV
jgi:hypothetical protein